MTRRHKEGTKLATPVRQPTPDVGTSGSKRQAEEIATLKAELAQARARIGELEKQRAEALDRIEWSLDSLHTLLERKG